MIRLGPFVLLGKIDVPSKVLDYYRMADHEDY